MVVSPLFISNEIVMNIYEVERQLPNGFHDAFLKSVAIDYIKGTAVLEIEAWTGKMSEPLKRERYRGGRLNFSGLIGFVSDLPNNSFLSGESTGLGISLSPEGDVPKPFIKVARTDVSQEVFFASFYFEDCSSFLSIAATNCAWDFLTEEREIY